MIDKNHIKYLRIMPSKSRILGGGILSMKIILNLPGSIVGFESEIGKVLKSLQK